MPQSAPTPNFFRKHKKCTWKYSGTGLKPNSQGDVSPVLAFYDADCGISETMPIHERTATIAIGNRLLEEMKWRKDHFVFGNVEFIRSITQLAPDKATFFYPTMKHLYSNDHGGDHYENVN